jgi:hypothetical protein
MGHPLFVEESRFQKLRVGHPPNTLSIGIYRSLLFEEKPFKYFRLGL